MNWTLQFVRPLRRDAVVRDIHSRLVPGGCMILLEKVLCAESLLNRLYIDLYYDFKKREGYSESEIATKRESLENVLVPYRVEENIVLLQRNGFGVVDVFFRWYNWAGFIAVKMHSGSDVG
jgi:tRNA (cmo5U34)-methyltransferase